MIGGEGTLSFVVLLLALNVHRLRDVRLLVCWDLVGDYVKTVFVGFIIMAALESCLKTVSTSIESILIMTTRLRRINYFGLQVYYGYLHVLPVLNMNIYLV